MRLLAIPLAAGLLVAGESLSTDYGHARTLRLTSEASFDVQSTFEMKVDGEVRPGRGSGGASTSLVRKAVIADQVLEGEGAKAKKVRRTFETLSESSEMSFGEDTREDQHESPLQGVALLLTLGKDGKPEAEVVEGKAPEDGALLEGHELELCLDALLPSEAVEEGKGWSLEDEAVKR